MIQMIMSMRSLLLIKKVKWPKHRRQKLLLKNYSTRMVDVVMITLGQLKNLRIKLSKVILNMLILLIRQ